MARPANTYRAARRNACVHELHQPWTADWYYVAHRNRPQWALERGLDNQNNRPIYVADAPKWRPKVGKVRDFMHRIRHWFNG